MESPNSSPPGLQGNLEHVTSGGDHLEWRPLTRQRNYTNAFIIRDDKILLGYKKRGFGMNMYNGFGGKVEVGETFQEAAERELKEEAGITASLEHAGNLLFTVGGEDAFFIQIYRGEEYVGTITETDEMRPEWFALPSNFNSNDTPPIPFERMWADDIHWMPLLISKTNFMGRADFSRAGDAYTMNKWWFGTCINA